MQTMNWHPGTLLQVSGNYWMTFTLHTAVKLDLFTLLAGGRTQSAEAIAASLATEPRATVMLLDALCAMGLLHKAGGGYQASEAAEQFLAKTSDRYVGHMIMHHHHLAPSWIALGEAVRTGQPVRGRDQVDAGKWREAFLMGMFTLASLQAPDIVGRIDLQGRRNLLDLGGGPGTYAIHFCLHNPELNAVVFDLATTEPFAAETISRYGLRDRVRFRPGDYHADPLETGFDVVWLSHILHAEGPDACARLVKKAAGALRPGGVMFIHEFYLNDTKDGPLFPALFSMNMLLGTRGGQSYSEGEVRGMLQAAGIEAIERLAYTGPTESGILKGVRR